MFRSCTVDDDNDIGIQGYARSLIEGNIFDNYNSKFKINLICMI